MSGLNLAKRALCASAVALILSPFMAQLPGGEAAAQGYYSQRWRAQQYFIDEPVVVRRVVRTRRGTIERPVAARRAETRRRAAAAKADLAIKELKKPDGPLVIAISIDRQNLKIYDANGLFAESPISSGTASHPTPRGVFSIIQKSRHHRSNLYSNAPMPYMQRITWSGVALHEGLLPGYPASHGCIRLPREFAARLWQWTRLGARVVISSGELTLSEVSHAILTTEIPETAKAAEAPVNLDLRLTTMTAALESRAEAVVSDANEPAKEVKKTAEPEIVTPAAGGSEPAPAAQKAVQENPPLNAAPPDTTVPPQPQIAASPRPNGHLALFVSRKEGKLYVRQGFEPWFDVAVTIADRDQPLGTHVFSALPDGIDAKKLRWSGMSMPYTPPKPPAQRRAKNAPPVIAVEPQPIFVEARQALDRISVPQDAIDRLASLWKPGASLVVSDEGLGPETGRGTDFIVLTR